MNHFDVLKEETDIYKSYLLEASAGTGKTFSIENIVVRLLLEPHPKQQRPLTIEEILIVTFTKAATSDLKVRVRKNIQNSLKHLKENSAAHFQFLEKFLSEGGDVLQKAIKSLEQALFCFDQAQVYTIHGFCSKMLKEHVFEGDLRLDVSLQQQLSVSDTKQVIKNFFRSHISYHKYNHLQIALLLKQFKGNYEDLENAVFKISTQGFEIKKSKTFQQLFTLFEQHRLQIKNTFSLTSETILSEYQRVKKDYKKLKEIKDVEAAIEAFAHLFDQKECSLADFENLVKDGVVIYDFLHPDNLKKNKSFSLEENGWYLHLAKSLVPVVNEARSSDMILANMASDFRVYLKKYCLEEETFHFDDFLTRMAQALEHTKFLQSVRKKFLVGIVDEFQDTDALQWHIFQKIFLESLEEEKFLYLVGDPKQSIYSFRSADIYTYLQAAQTLGKNAIATLNVNYRSKKTLVDALNTIFCEKNSPQLMPLPKMDSFLPYTLVEAGKKEGFLDFDDSFGDLHFFVGEKLAQRSNSYPLEELEKESFFPFIAQEIIKLVHEKKMSFNQIAILVSDHHQAERISNFLQQKKIPVCLQKSASLADSEALKSMKELIEAFMNLEDESVVKIALGGRVIQMSHEELLLLENPEILEEVFSKLLFLRDTLFEKGFSSLYEELLKMSFFNLNKPILKNLVLDSSGLQFYNDLQQIAELLMEYQSQYRSSVDGLLRFLDTFDQMQTDEDPRMRKRSDPQAGAVSVVTLHSSKGLEYDIVFALGVVKRSPVPGKIVPCREGHHYFLKAVITKDDPDYTEYCKELNAEKMRLFYVGLTRAKNRLYVPIAKVENSIAKPGTASMMELFLESCKNFEATIHSCPHITHALVNVDEHLKQVDSEKKCHLKEPCFVNVTGKDLFMQSFSSLTRNQELVFHHDKEMVAPQNFEEEKKTAFSLPAGSETGNFLHSMLETLSFQCYNISAHVEKYTTGSKYFSWSSTICEMIEKTLKEEIHHFCLQDVLDEETYRELEFVYPIDENLPEIEDISPSPGFLKGIIDLIFKYKDKYYIIDWKSNWLGKETSDYDFDSIHQCMIKHRYYLQAALYKEALRRYLALVCQEPFEDVYGGTYYIFLRASKVFNVDRHLEAVCQG